LEELKKELEALEEEESQDHSAEFAPSNG